MRARRLLHLFDLVDAIGEKKPVYNDYYATTNIAIGPDEICIYENKTDMIVCIGGSSGDTKEWIGNFSAFPLIKGVHNNYMLSARKIVNSLRNRVDSSLKRVTWVGYSRGGAIAQLCCEQTRGTCVTFGSPKPYTNKHQLLRRYEHILVRSKGDGVTRLPWFFPRKFTKGIVLRSVKGMDHTAYHELLADLI